MIKLKQHEKALLVRLCEDKLYTIAGSSQQQSRAIEIMTSTLKEIIEKLGGSNI